MTEEQTEAAARAAGLAEETEKLQAEVRKLQEAKRSWAEGELDRRGAAALLEEARTEAARIKARPLLLCLPTLQYRTQLPVHM